VDVTTNVVEAYDGSGATSSDAVTAAMPTIAARTTCRRRREVARFPSLDVNDLT
jgi:hypothetical protein